MRQHLRDHRVRHYVDDVEDLDTRLRLSRDIDHVSHAAALKQVRSCERIGVASLVFLSTDKAAYPVNAVGVSKALMEKTVQAHVRHSPAVRTVVSCVRYSNVMRSVSP